MHQHNTLMTWIIIIILWEDTSTKATDGTRDVSLAIEIIRHNTVQLDFGMSISNLYPHLKTDKSSTLQQTHSTMKPSRVQHSPEDGQSTLIKVSSRNRLFSEPPQLTKYILHGVTANFTYLLFSTFLSLVFSISSSSAHCPFSPRLTCKALILVSI